MRLSVRSSVLSPHVLGRSSSFGLTLSEECLEPPAVVLNSEAGHSTIGSQFVFRENDVSRKVWDFILIFLLIYTSTYFTYRMTFVHMHIPQEIKEPGYWDVIDEIASILFLFDLGFGFFLSYRGKDEVEIVSLRMCITNYVFGSFAINVIACIPASWVDFLSSATLGAANSREDSSGGVNQIARVARLQRVSRLARLLRLGRLTRLKAILRSNRLVRGFMKMRIVLCLNFIFGLTVAIHLLACLWYVSAALNPDTSGDTNEFFHTWVGRRTLSDGPDGPRSLIDESPAAQWLHSMYFVLTVFSTVGFGDMSAVTLPEIVCVSVIIIIGTIIHSIIISKVISILTSVDQAQTYISEQDNLICRFADHTNLTDSCLGQLQDFIQGNAKLWYSNTYDRDDMKRLVCDRLPRKILAELPRLVFDGQLLSNRFLTLFLDGNGMCPRFPVLLALSLYNAHFAAGEIVYQLFEHPTNLFFVAHGTFSCIARVTLARGYDTIPDQSEIPNTSDSVTTRICSIAQSSVVTNQSRTTLHHLKHLFPYRLFSKDSFFGEFEMIYEQNRGCSVRCEKEKSRAFTCSKVDFVKVAEEFPRMVFSWKFTARRRERLRKRSLMALTRRYNSEQRAAATILHHYRTMRKRWSMSEYKDFMTPTSDEFGSRMVGSDCGLPRRSCSDGNPGTLALAEVRDLQRSVDDMRWQMSRCEKMLETLVNKQTCWRCDDEAHI